MISMPLLDNWDREAKNTVTASEPTAPTPINNPCPLAPTPRTSTAIMGIIIMYELPKKLLKNVMAIRKPKMEFFLMKSRPSTMSW